ncbi:hypothetical protein B0I35DRAFT_17645 [Stachybotrys elegans]|uniref:Uncharacterized protein n=1 Tax=Stachybotrys elegans TaxID=80388 RepID=A0A8K0T6T0_9HYPO|nr:hypothetical protein B0I35DRAFT_17645 [Stachybotrys elegans]
MDPEEYILHSHPGSPGSYGSSADRRHQTSWTGQLRVPQPPRYSWMDFNASLSGPTAGSGASSPPSPSHRRSGNPPFHLGHPASPLPPPDPAFPGVPQQDPFAPPLFWNSSLQQTSGPHTLALPSIVHPPVPSRSHSNSSLPSPNSRNQRGFSTFQPPTAAGAPSFPPGTICNNIDSLFSVQLRVNCFFPPSPIQALCRQ